MKKIYIILTYTGTILSQIVKVYTRREFSHVSISLDEELTKMYSFGRINPYNPFSGGFVHERVNEGTFKRFKNTKTKIYSLEIPEEKYKELEKLIKDMYSDKDSYKFNILGLIGILVNYKVKRENYFYCAEFVKYVLETSSIIDLPDLVKPEDFESIYGLDEIYRGLLREYKTGTE